MAAQLKWWRVGFVKITGGEWGAALNEGYQLMDTPCTKTVGLCGASKARSVGSMLIVVDLPSSCPGTSDRKGCGRRVEHGNRFCQHHICQIHSCQAPRTRSSDFCADHGCLTVGCHQLRQTQIQGLRRGTAGGLFCEDHACRYVGCRNETAEDSDRCLQHGGGRVPSFRQRVVDPGDERPTRVRRTDFRSPNSYRDNSGDGRQDGQRQLGWAETRHSDPWAAWGMAI